MLRGLSVSVLALTLISCGSNGLAGTLQWDGNPRVDPHALSGRIQNTTSHSLTLDVGSMRLLDARGRKVRARFTLDTHRLTRGGQAQLRATWKSGKPVRIDYGSGTLALPSG